MVRFEEGNLQVMIDLYFGQLILWENGFWRWAKPFRVRGANMYSQLVWMIRQKRCTG
jgi:hypothetical protein